MRFLVVGSGFAGAVLARELADHTDHSIDVIDARDHIGGNCHTHREPETGITVHTYGAHIFHTSDRQVWNYVQRFTEMMPFINRPKASIDKGIFSLPVNLHTINQYFGKKFSPSEARQFVDSIRRHDIERPRNFEEQALHFMGDELYRAFFHGYTKKHWGCEPEQIPASVLKRLPLRFNYNDNYYSSIYQGIPREGYTAIFERLLDHPRISLTLNHRWQPSDGQAYDHVFYSGPLDGFFGHRRGRLGYRTVFWERQIETGDVLGHPGINFPSLDVTFTRRREHKHYEYWKQHEKTIVFTEYSKETGTEDEPYYPKRLAADKALLQGYLGDCLQTERTSFLGRLGLYKYMDMHQVIAESLSLAREFIAAIASGEPRPIFPEAFRLSLS
jgi:UDP-galactopyranose mutase